MVQQVCEGERSPCDEAESMNKVRETEEEERRNSNTRNGEGSILTAPLSASSCVHTSLVG